MGFTGPNGRHFRFDCMVSLRDTPPGIPHAQVIFPRYSDDDTVTKRSFTPRTFEEVREMVKKLLESNKKSPADFANCEHQPLINGEGEIVNATSVTPLHIPLGLGVKILEAVETLAVEEDQMVFDAKGISSNEMKILYQQRKDIQTNIEKLNNVLQQTQAEAQILLESITAYQAENNFAFHRDDLKKFIDKSPIKTFTTEIKAADSRLEDILKQAEQISGPFRERLGKVLSKLNLKRQVYHSGALIGEDVHKLTRKSNVILLSQVFEPLALSLDSGDSQTFGSAAIKQKVYTRLSTFASCYELFMANRYLCRHEVIKLCARAYSFGNWLPVNFAQESLIRKFHMLTHEVPRKALLQRSVRLEAEHCSESIHPFVNRWQRVYCTLQDPKTRLSNIAKAQWLNSDTDV